MLERLLHVVDQGGALSVPHLARRLDVSEALVEQMLADLVRMGHLRVVEGCQAGRCAACPMAQACAMIARPRIWQR
ncbi:MAG: MarR family transcriptional regulator [Anaerolineales bacterium]|nr:MarR family transcriptional regulator [Anaerolineales bacterium]